MRYRCGIKILEARIGIESNMKELLPSFPPRIEVSSLLTDFMEIEELPYSGSLDGYILIHDDESHPSFFLTPTKAVFKGRLQELVRKASDQRFSLWGNQGFLFRYALHLLEKVHKIYNFHGCALYEEKSHRLFIIIGGAGSGKTVYLLSGLERGLKLFSTEIVHFRHTGKDVEWYMGSLVDNVRLDTLKYSFPRFMPGFEIKEGENLRLRKIAIDLSSYRAEDTRLVNPSVVCIFPRIEEGRRGFNLSLIPDIRKRTKMLFEHASQKISETLLLYDEITITGLESMDSARLRFDHVSRLSRHFSLKTVGTVLSNASECWGNLLQN